jgi:hypothetical protein
MRNRFAVEHDAGGGEAAHGVGNRDEVARPVTAVARPQVHPLAVLMGDDAEAVVLELVLPSVPGRHLGGEDGPAGEDMKPGGLMSFGLAQRVGLRINMDAPL